MNRFFPLAICLLAFILCVPALAVDDTSINNTAAEPAAQETQNETSSDSNIAPETTAADNSSSQQQAYSVASLDSSASLTESGTASTMSDVVTGVLGEYHQKTNTVNTYASDGTLVSTTTEAVPGLAGLDYPWIAGAVFMALLLYGILRLIGGLIKL